MSGCKWSSGGPKVHRTRDFLVFRPTHLQASASYCVLSPTQSPMPAAGREMSSNLRNIGLRGECIVWLIGAVAATSEIVKSLYSYKQRYSKYLYLYLYQLQLLVRKIAY